MSLYSLILFLHVVGAVLLFAAFGLDWTGLHALRRATMLGNVRQWLPVLAKLRFLYLGALAAILFPGLYMTLATWGWTPWIIVALVSVLFLAGFGMTVNRARMMAIGRAMASEDENLSNGFREKLRDPVLWMSIHLRAAVAFGIVFLMTVRPGLVGALVAIATASALGLVLGSRGKEQPHSEAAAAA